VVDVVDDTDIAVKTSEEDDVQLVELVEVNEGAEERRGRRQNREQITDVPELPPMPIPPPEPDVEIPEAAYPLPELQLNKPIICPECDSRFEAPLDIQATRCPVCGDNIVL
jgi:DNA-directed RNA polymerase subunit RPC12/RpoP